jgi:tetratricopeptide (TPR) repeat protein
MKIVWIAGLLLLAAAPLRAQDARELFVRGEEAFAHGRYEDAIRDWQAAFELDPRPRLLFNVARAHERLGALETALATFERFLAEAPEDEPVRETAVRNVAALRERIARTAILVVDAPHGATISVDGEERGLAPRPDPILVSPGDHEVVVRSGGDVQRFRIVVTAGRQLEVRAAPTTPTTQRPVGESRSVGPWVCAALGVGAVVGTGVVGGLAFARSGDAIEGTSDARSARRLGRTADALGGIGAASLVTGLVWWLVADRDDEERDEGTDVTVAPVVSSREVGARVGVRF